MRLWFALFVVVIVAVLVGFCGSSVCKRLEAMVKSPEHYDTLVKAAIDKTPPFDMSVSVPIKVPINKEYTIGLGKTTFTVNVLVVDARHHVQGSAVFFYNKIMVDSSSAVPLRDGFIIKPVTDSKLQLTAKDGKELGSLNCSGSGCYLVIAGSSSVHVAVK